MSATGYLGLQLFVLAFQFQFTEPNTIESFFCMIAVVVFAVAAISQISRKNVF